MLIFFIIFGPPAAAYLIACSYLAHMGGIHDA